MERWLWGRVFRWRGWYFWRQRPQLGVCSCFPAAMIWLCCVRPKGPCLTDALFLFFLQVDLEVSPLSPLLAVCWWTWIGAAVMTTLKVLCLPLLLGWQLVTIYLISVRHHSKSLLMQSYPLTLLKSSHIRRAQGSEALKWGISSSASALGLQRFRSGISVYLISTSSLLQL